MGRVAATSLLLSTAAIAAFAYKLATADQYERSCGLTNIFRWDYSDEIRKGIRVVKNGSNIAIDFSNLKRWERICLISMYEDSFYFPNDSVEHLGPSYEMGKWQCGQEPDRTISIALVTRDGGTLGRQFKLPTELVRDVETFYGEYTPTEKLRQCSDVRNAIARCEEMPSLKPGRCILMFRKHEQR